MSMERCTACEGFYDTDYDVEGYVGETPYHGHCRPELYGAFMDVARGTSCAE